MASRTPQKATAHPKQEISITYSHPLLITRDLTVRVLDSNWHQGHEFLMFGLQCGNYGPPFFWSIKFASAMKLLATTLLEEVCFYVLSRFHISGIITLSSFIDY